MFLTVSRCFSHFTRLYRYSHSLIECIAFVFGTWKLEVGMVWVSVWFRVPFHFLPDYDPCQTSQFET